MFITDIKKDFYEVVANQVSFWGLHFLHLFASKLIWTVVFISLCL